ncbi:MAG: hypothetical protein WC454_04635 [Phycisphaerae bacterium]|jgi:hypothetical protein
MGEEYIKNEDGKEVVYEKGFLVDKKIGELHEKWDGSKETRNVFGENVRVESPSIWGERKAEVDGQKGVFREGFFEGHPTFKSEESVDSRGCSYPTASSTSSTATTRGGIGVIIGLAIIVIVGIGYFTGSSDKTGEANKDQVQISQQELSLNGLKYTVQVWSEEDIPSSLKQLLQRNTFKLLGDLEDYEAVIIDVGNNKNAGNCDVALVSSGATYAFHSSDGGKTWITGPFWSGNIPSELTLKMKEILHGKRDGSDHQNKKPQQETSINDGSDIISPTYRVVLIPQYQERSVIKEEESKRSNNSGSSPLVDAGTQKQQIVIERDIPKDIPSPKHPVVALLKSSQTLLLDGASSFHMSWWLEKELNRNPQLKKALVDLAAGIYEQTGNSTDIVDWFQKGENLWAVGSFGGLNARGIVCHSPNNGKTWTRQWWSTGSYQESQAIGIYFSDSSEGWVLLLGGILHTTDGGTSWREISENSQLIFHNLFILEEKRFAVSSQPLFCFNYTEDGGLSWKRFKEGEKEYDNLLAELEKTFNIEIPRLRYGKIYAEEENITNK